MPLTKIFQPINAVVTTTTASVVSNRSQAPMIYAVSASDTVFVLAAPTASTPTSAQMLAADRVTPGGPFLAVVNPGQSLYVKAEVNTANVQLSGAVDAGQDQSRPLWMQQNEWIPITTRGMTGNGSDINIGSNFAGCTFRTYEKTVGADAGAFRLVFANAYAKETAGANDITIKAGLQISRGTSLTATSGGATTITVSTASWTTNEYSGKVVFLTGGTGAGQYRFITSNTATALTVPTWTTNPDSTTTFEIFDHYPVYFGGTRSKTLAGGEWVVSDIVGGFAAAGTKMFVHTYVSVSSGGHIPGIRRAMYDGAANAATVSMPWGECCNIMDGGITLSTGYGGTDMVDSGDIQGTANSGNYTTGATYKGIPRDVGSNQNWITGMTDTNDGGPMFFGPVAILGLAASRVKPAFGLIGDSRAKPTPVVNTTSSPATISGAVQENGSWLALALANAGYPHIVVANSGEGLYEQVGSKWNLRDYLLNRTDYELIWTGINDMVSNSKSAAYIINYLDLCCKRAAAAGRRPVLVTFPPKATSSASDAASQQLFVLASVQSADASNTVVQAVNTAIRAGTVSTAAWGYWDAAALVEDGGATAPTGKWADAPLFIFLDGTTTSTVGTVLSNNLRFTDSNLPAQTTFGTWGNKFQDNAPCQGYAFLKFVTSTNSNTLYYRLNVLASGQTKALTSVTSTSGIIVAGDTYQVYMPYTYGISASDRGLHLTPYGKYVLATNFNPQAYPAF